VDFHTFTDAEGRFAFEELQIGNYDIGIFDNTRDSKPMLVQRVGTLGANSPEVVLDICR
jgi:hypothetical protein